MIRICIFLDSLIKTIHFGIMFYYTICQLRQGGMLAFLNSRLNYFSVVKIEKQHCELMFPSFPPLVAQLVKNPPVMRSSQFNSWVEKIPWRRDRLSIPVFSGFPGGSDGKESSSCNAGDLGSVPRLGRSPEEGMATHSTIPDQRISVDTGTWRTAVHEAAELDMTE